MSWVMGIDLGGTKVAFGLVNPDNDIVVRARMDTNADDGLEIVSTRIADQINQLTSHLPAGESLVGVGICTPGPVDHITGDLLTLVNLPGISNTPFRQALEDKLGIPVKLDHDAKVAALGEFYYGSAQDRDSTVYVVIGTGVGAAIIYEGNLLYGESYTAGESGHMTVNPEGHQCSCGSRGCLETYTSGPWLEKHYAAQAGENITGAEITRRARDGDDIALDVIQQAGQALGIAVASMAMFINIETFVIGGSVARAGTLLIEPALASVKRYSFKAVGDKVRILQSSLGDDAPILGGAWMARQMI